MDLEITTFDEAGNVTSHQIVQTELASQERIDEMVMMIEAGTPAFLAAELTKHPQC